MDSAPPRSTAWVTLAETGAALAAALGLTLAASVAIVVLVLVTGPGHVSTLEVPLRPLGGIPAEQSPDEVLERIARLSVARKQWIDLTRETPVLGFVGIPSTEALERALIDLLPASGYAIGGLDLRPRIDPTALMTDLRVILPGLTVQAAIFSLMGWGLMRWRVPAVSASRASAGAIGAVGWGLLGGVLAVGVGTGLGTLLEALGLPVHEQPLLVDLLSDPRTLALLAPWIVLAAPISEEIFFRGYVFRFVSARTGVVLGVAVSSLLFGAVHLNPTGLPIYMAVGATFALAYRRSASLLTPITAHVAYNGILLAGMALSGVG